MVGKVVVFMHKIAFYAQHNLFDNYPEGSVKILNSYPVKKNCRVQYVS